MKVCLLCGAQLTGSQGHKRVCAEIRLLDAIDRKLAGVTLLPQARLILLNIASPRKKR